MRRNDASGYFTIAICWDFANTVAVNRIPPLFTRVKYSIDSVV
jgi:hypothetical protein